MKRFSLLLVVAAALIGSTVSARADILWDQSSCDAFGAGYFDMVAGTPPFGLTVYTASDVTVPADGWVVQSVSIYSSNLDFDSWAGITQARLNIFLKTNVSPLATDLPTAGTPVGVTMIPLDGGNYWEIRASGLNMPMAAGDYWIGLTPIAPNANELHLAHTGALIGSASYSWDPFAPVWVIGGFPGADATDAAFKVEGLLGTPTPTLHGSWGQLKALYH